MIALLSLLLQAAAPQAAPPAPPQPPLGTPIVQAGARRVLDAALAEARRQGFTMSIAVVEPDGSLVAFARDEGAPYASIVVAQEKARTAALFRRPTLAWSQQVAAGRLQVLSLPNVVAIEGGVPLVAGGKLVGAIGVSGGTSEQDGVIAAAGAAAVGNR